VLPAVLDSRPIVAAAELFAGLLRWCIEPPGKIHRIPDNLKELIAALPIAPQARARWNR
jgi:hypothetical protein